jgi:putative ABC transport system substrate-binding protein
MGARYFKAGMNYPWGKVFAAALIMALAFASPAHAQKQKVNRVAYIVWTGPVSLLAGPGRSPNMRTFVNRLSELGYVEGVNLQLDFYTLDGRSERIPEVLATIVRSKPDLIFTVTQIVVEQQLEATKGIPVVTLATWNLVGTGAVRSLARPGGNVTGFILDVDESAEAKRLEQLREAVPGIKRVAYLGVPLLWESPAGKRVRDAAQGLGLSLFHAAYTGTSGDVEAAAAVIEREAPDAVYVPLGSASFTYRKQIGEFVSARHLPCIAGFKEVVEHGCLMSYGVDIADVTRRSAGYVAKILEGAKPGDLPIQQPSKFELVINLKAARALGLTLPRSVLLRADQVIE